MKRLISVLLALLLLAGCGQKVITPTQHSVATAASTGTVLPTASPVQETPTPTPTPAPAAAPRPVLPTFAPMVSAEALFPEELLSANGDPILSQVRALCAARDMTKVEFFSCFQNLIELVDDLDAELLRLSAAGRILTADRKAETLESLTSLVSDKTLRALQDAFAACDGAGEALPVTEFSRAMKALIRDVRGMQARTATFFDLGPDTPRAYLRVLSRYMGEAVTPADVFDALEVLMETEAIALNAALKADPEAGRKKELISLGSFEENMAFLIRVSKDLCPLQEGAALPVPPKTEDEADLDLLTLAYRYYPGLGYLKAYSVGVSEEQRPRWADAPAGYLRGLAVHNSFAVLPYIEAEGFELEYLQYKWYEHMLDVTMTAMASLLIHYYGYTEKDLSAYLKDWGADSFTGYLYAKAMDDPFDSLVAVYGYYHYLDICEAALDVGCPTEKQFLRDYLAAGPAPYASLKEYMVSLYQKQG